MWCPLCDQNKDEAQTICDTCGELLIKSKKEDYKILFSDKSDDIVIKTYNYLLTKNLSDISYYFDPKTDEYVLLTSNDEHEETKLIIVDFIKRELDYFKKSKEQKEDYDNSEIDNSLKVNLNEEELQKKIAEYDMAVNNFASLANTANKVYKKKKDKYEDLRSSAYSLLFIGVIGFTIILLMLAKIIDFNLSAVSFSIFVLSMGTLFVIFIASGAYSLVKANKVKNEITDEKDLTEEIKDYITTTISSNTEIKIVSQDETQEVKYFARSEYIKKLVKNKFGEQDDAFIDFIIDEIYDDLF